MAPLALSVALLFGGDPVLGQDGSTLGGGRTHMRPDRFQDMPILDQVGPLPAPDTPLEPLAQDPNVPATAGRGS